MLFCFPRGVLDDILNFIESVSEGFPSYLSSTNYRQLLMYKLYCLMTVMFGKVAVKEMRVG